MNVNKMEDKMNGRKVSSKQINGNKMEDEQKWREKNQMEDKKCMDIKSK